MNARLASRDQPRRAASPRRLVNVAMLIVPLTITAVAVIVMLLAGGDLAREVVIHWGVEGPDGWAPAWTYPLAMAVVGAALPLILWLSLKSSRRVGATAVFLAGFMIWLSAFLAISFTAALVVQPADVGGWLLIAAAVGLALATPAWVWLPREAPLEAAPTEIEHVELAPGEVAVFSRTVHARPAFYWTIGLATALVLAAAIVATVVTAGLAWPVFAAPLVLIALLVLAPGWRVTAGPAGLTVRGLAGFPVFRVPPEDVQSVAVVDLDPMADFGGWGIRWAPGAGGRSRTGIVVRAGQALEVTRRDGRQLLVTVDDAAVAAAVLRANSPESA